jgi:hypothetical protein
MTTVQALGALDIKDIKVKENEVRINLVNSYDFSSFVPKHDHTIPMQEEDGEFRYGVGSNGVISFGFWSYDKNDRPGHGGLWSSNAATFNSVVEDCNAVYVVINNMSLHMEVQVLQAILDERFPGEYKVSLIKSRKEPYYRVHKASFQKVLEELEANICAAEAI